MSIHNRINHFKDMSVTVKIFISYSLIILISLGIFASIIYTNLIQNSLEQSNHFYSSITNDFRNAIQDEMNEIQETGKLIADSKLARNTLVDDPENYASTLFEQKNEFNPYMNFIANTDKDIYNLTFYTQYSEIPKSAYIRSAEELSKAEWFQGLLLMDYRSEVWESPHSQRDSLNSSTEQIISYYRNIYTTDYKNIAATMQIDISLEQLYQKLLPIDLEDRSIYVFTDNDNNVVPILNYPSTLDDIEQILSQYYVTESPNQSYKFFESSLIEAVDLKVVTLVPYNDYVNDYIKQQRLFYLLIFVAAIVLLIISYALSKFTNKNLSKVLTGIRKITNGNFEVTIDIDNKDELGEIAHDLNIMASKLDRMVNQVITSETAAAKAQNNYLLAQINPHFLYNTLESIKMIAEINGEFHVADLLTALGKYLRYTISSTNNTAMLKEELENLQYYRDIIAIRYDNSITFTINCEKQLYENKIIKQSLQPIVENSLIHGFSSTENMKIEINVFVHDKKMYVEIINSGNLIKEPILDSLNQKLSQDCSLMTDITSSTGGIGLINVNERIKLTYGNEFGINLSNIHTDTFNGVRVLCTYPAERI